VTPSQRGKSSSALCRVRYVEMEPQVPFQRCVPMQLPRRVRRLTDAKRPTSSTPSPTRVSASIATLAKGQPRCLAAALQGRGLDPWLL
jgi:hypothetical protein